MKELSKRNKILLVIISIFLLISVIGLVYYYNYNPFDSWDDDEFHSNNIILIDNTNNKILYEKNSDEKVAPASLTKIMTTLVAIENIENLDEVVGIDIDTYKTMVRNNASMAGFFGKEPVNYRDLLYGTMLPSGGEAAGTLAKKIGNGNMENFVKLMNDKVDELELENTNFGNPEGLDDNKTYTTANDMAKIFQEALKNNTFREIVTSENFTSTKTLDHPDGLKMESTVLKPLKSEDTTGYEILGGKSGTTLDAGLCWATIGEKDGIEYIVVTLGAPLDKLKNPTPYQMKDHLNIYNKIERKKFFN